MDKPVKKSEDLSTIKNFVLETEKRAKHFILQAFKDKDKQKPPKGGAGCVE